MPLLVLFTAAGCYSQPPDVIRSRRVLFIASAPVESVITAPQSSGPSDALWLLPPPPLLLPLSTAPTAPVIPIALTAMMITVDDLQL